MRPRARRRILDHVATHPGADAAQIARALGMKPPAVRHHLSILRSDGRLEAAAVLQGKGRGRPRLAYRVSKLLAGDNLAMLADHLLGAGKTKVAGGQRESPLVAGLARRLGEQLQPPQALPSAARRLAALLDRLNELHYRARWEAGAEGPRVIFGHCPYYEVIDRHPELCQMDAQAVAAILNAEVKQKAKIAPRGDGSLSCIFALRYL